MKILLLSIILLFTTTKFCSAQCSGGSDEGSLGVIGTSFTTRSVAATSYYTFTVTSTCDSYFFTFCSTSDGESTGASASFDTQLTILDNTGAYAGGYNDDHCGLQSEISNWNAPSLGTYRLLVNRFSCGGSTSNVGTLAFKLKNTISVSPSGYTLTDDATASGTDCVTLTSSVTDQRGCIWNNTSTMDFSVDFSEDFKVNLGSSDAGADGMTFVIQNDPSGICACGGSGGSFGAGGITNSLIIEIDTYFNTEDRDDGIPGSSCSGGDTPDHLDLWVNGDVNPAAPVDCTTGPGARVIPNAIPLLDGFTDYNIENGLDHTLRITWIAATSTLTATVLDDAGVKEYGIISYSFDPMTLFGTTTPNFGFTASTGGLSNDQSICLPTTSLLDVKFGEFNVFCQENGSLLEWSTVMEKNSSHFILYRSYDGKQFEKVDEIESNQNTSSLLHYSYIDNSVESGTVYYTISEVSLEGKETKSGIVRIVDCKIDKQLEIYPNPLDGGDIVNLRLDTDELVQVNVFDAQGKLVLQKGRFNCELDQLKLDFSKGVYTISVITPNGKTYYKKCVIN